MLQLVPLAFELLKAICHHILVVLEVLRLDALGYHQLLLEILSPINVPGGGTRTSQATSSSYGAEEREAAGFRIPPLILGLGELATLFCHVVTHGTSDAGGCLSRQEKVVHGFLLIPRQLESLAHSDDEKRDQESSPEGRDHDDHATDVRVGDQVSEADCRDRDHNDPNRLEVAIKIDLPNLPIVFYLKYP